MIKWNMKFIPSTIIMILLSITSCDIWVNARGRIYETVDANKAGVKIVNTEEDLKLDLTLLKDVSITYIKKNGESTKYYNDSSGYFNKTLWIDPFIRKNYIIKFEKENYKPESVRGLLIKPGSLLVVILKKR